MLREPTVAGQHPTFTPPQARFTLFRHVFFSVRMSRAVLSMDSNGEPESMSRAVLSMDSTGDPESAYGTSVWSV